MSCSDAFPNIPNRSYFFLYITQATHDLRWCISHNLGRGCWSDKLRINITYSFFIAIWCISSCFVLLYPLFQVELCISFALDIAWWCSLVMSTVHLLRNYITDFAFFSEWCNLRYLLNITSCHIKTSSNSEYIDKL